MKTEITYLSDEELEQLIFTVEQQELVAAPPELLDRILEAVESPENKVKEFRGYCFRVLTSVAAAVAIVFLMPGLQNIQLPEVSEWQNKAIPNKYATEEEALGDDGILARTLGGVTIFDNNNRFEIFSERDGGKFNETKER